MLGRRVVRTTLELENREATVVLLGKEDVIMKALARDYRVFS